jgi:hypothetical protein
VTALLPFLFLACLTSDDADTGFDTGTADTCEADTLPAVTDPISVNATVYDPDAGCWGSITVELSDALWSAYDTTDTGAPSCDDVTVMLARVDCSCVRLSSSCGDVATAKAGDPAVVTTAAAEERCTEFEATATTCP